MTAAVFTVEFADHTSDYYQRLVLGFLNALSGEAQLTGETAYTFRISRASRIPTARKGLSEWEDQGLILWSEAPA